MLIFENYNQPQSSSSVLDGDKDMFCSIIESMQSLDDLSFNVLQSHTESMYYGYADNNMKIVVEGFGDFLKSASDFFKKMMDKIKEYFKKLVMMMTAYLGDFKKFLTKNATYLKQLTPDFKIKGYEYTINENVPNMEPLSKCIDSYRSNVGEIAKVSLSDVKKEREEFMSTSNLDKLRSTVLGTGYSIDSDDFLEEVRKSFRHGQNDAVEIDVNQSLLVEVMNSYERIEKSYKKSCEDRDDILILLSKLVDFFGRGAQVRKYANGDSVEYKDITINNNKMETGETKSENDSNASLKTINVYFNFKYIQAKEISSMISVVVMEKSNAIKEQLKQSKNIVRKSMSGKNNKGV